jgi:WS/DGAT/MGAT family acyltransferase
MMASSDTIIWHIEEDPHLRSTVMAIWELDAEPTSQRMGESLDRMVAAIPRLRQRVEPGRPRPRWVDVDRVDLARHFLERDLGGSGRIDQVHEFASEWVRQPFDRAHPQWGLALVRGLAGGRAAIVIKVHHAIADGIGLVLMLAAFTDLEPNPERPIAIDDVIAIPVAREAFSPLRRLVFKAWRATRMFVRAPVATTCATAETIASALRLVWPSRKPLSPRMTARSGRLVLDTRTIAFREFRAAGRLAGGTLNDAFVTVVVDALARYHIAFTGDAAALERVRVHMPVDVRSGRTANVAGNEFVPARVVLNVPSGDAVQRLGAIQEQLLELQREPALTHINTVAAAVLKLGKKPTQWILGGMMKGVDVLASNVPGPNFPLYVAGVKVERFHAFGPPAGAALNITLFSYDGSVNLGITTDEAAVTDRELFLRCLDEAIAELLVINDQAVALTA